MWFEIILLDGNRGLLNINNITDIWMDNGADYATVLQVNDEELEIPSSEYDRLKRAVDTKGILLR